MGNVSFQKMQGSQVLRVWISNVKNVKSRATALNAVSSRTGSKAINSNAQASKPSSLKKKSSKSSEAPLFSNQARSWKTLNFKRPISPSQTLTSLRKRQFWERGRMGRLNWWCLRKQKNSTLWKFWRKVHLITKTWIWWKKLKFIES